MVRGGIVYAGDLFLGPAGSNLVILAGLVLAAVCAIRQIRGTGASPDPPRSALFSGSVWLYLAIGTVWAGFLLSGDVRWVWAVPIGATVFGLTAGSLYLLRLVHARHGESGVAGPSMAVVGLTAVLIELGLLLTIRLVVAPDPAVGFEAGLTTAAWKQGRYAIMAPLFFLALILGVLALALDVFPVGHPGKWQRWFRRPVAALRRRFSAGQDFLQRFRATHLVAILLVSGLFAAPLVRTEPNQLTIFGIATPEYGKLAYLWVLASILVNVAVYWRYPQLRRRHHHIHIAYPALLFTLVAVPSVCRGDLGPLIPVFLGTLGMLWCMLRAEAATNGTVRAQHGFRRELAVLRTVATSSRPLLWLALGIVPIFMAVALLAGHVRERFQVFLNPWVYGWASDCLPPPERVVPPVAAPSGTVMCQEALSTYLASRHSQIAQALSIIADGGIWGRGLGDTLSGRLPAGSTDFILAVLWNKLGGLVLLATAALVALLGWALMRTWWQLQSRHGPDGAPAPATRRQLFTAGLATALVGQFLFVLLATVNAMPHSGITAPFLSRGGQSTMALALGVVIAMVLAYQGRPTTGSATDSMVTASPGFAAHHPVRQNRGFTPAVVFALCAVMVIWVTGRPYSGYAERRPFCRADQARVDPAQCSTDRVAFARTTFELRIGGQPQYVRDRSTGRWEPITAAPAIELGDLAGLLQVGNKEGGVLDLAFAPEIGGSAGTSLGARLSPPTPDQLGRGSLDLTIDPAIQRAAANALRTDAGKLGPLAAGIVVLDASSGYVLAAASAPTDPPAGARAAATDSTTPAVDQATADEFNQNSQFGRRTAGGGIDLSSAAVESCRSRGPAVPDADQCARWLAVAAPKPSVDEAEQRRYVAGDQRVTPPSTEVNRALGRRYGLGSTFKVVVAAAYLQMPGKTAADLIDAPLQVARGSAAPIRNAGGGACRGTTREGKLTLTQALAVSCNTAFVKLARDIVGWGRIRDTAQRMGFTVGPLKERGPAWLVGSVDRPDLGMGVDSRVPEQAGPVELGNNVLGGGDVAGTPLQMATVMATVANGGVAVQPTLARAVTPPDTGQPRLLAGAQRPVLTTQQAEQLGVALSRTTSENGTAMGLETDRKLWVKTGTHEIYPSGETAPPDVFARQIAWLTGFLQTTAGPVAFAVAVETRDEAAGRDRADYLAKQVLAAITEVRG